METMLNNLVNDQLIYYGILSCLIVILMMLIIMIMNKRETIINNTIKQPVMEPVVLNPEVVTEVPLTDLEKVLAEMKQGVQEKGLNVTTFEQQQEEKAIISYQELLKNKPKLDFVAPMSTAYDEIADEQVINSNISVSKENDFPYVEKVVEPKKFQNSEFISPIYGRVENKTEYPTIKSFYEKAIPKFEDIEEVVVPTTMVNKPIVAETQAPIIQAPKEEVKVNDQFLDALKEFRKNLE